MKTPAKMLAEIPPEEHREMKRIYSSQKEILKKIFPRGRLRMFEDGRCVLVALNKRFEGDYVFVYGKDKLGLYTASHYQYWTMRLKPWFAPVPPVPCGEEGILYLRMKPELQTPLKRFMKGAVPKRISANFHFRSHIRPAGTP